MHEISLKCYHLCLCQLCCSVDATNPDGRLGRLVNDSAKPNCVMRKKLLDGVPVLCIYALKDLESNTELRYDYGVDSLPWRGKRVRRIYIVLLLRLITMHDLENRLD